MQLKEFDGKQIKSTSHDCLDFVNEDEETKLEDSKAATYRLDRSYDHRLSMAV